MSTELPGLIVPLEARVDQLERGLAKANRAQRRAAGQMERRAEQSARKMQKSYGRMASGITSAFKSLALPVLGAAGLGGIITQSQQATKAVAQIGNEAKRAGVSAKAFQEWKFVAQQNRIGLDQMVDGLKELNLRADEFISTGKGPAAEAFERLGFGADDLKDKLEDPSALLLEIIGRMQRLSVSARIRVADEVFGGSAGERFVELVDQGEDGLRRTIDRAGELGLVLDDAVIARADELDRKFDALLSRVSTLGKRIAVVTADIGAQMVDDIASIGDGPDPLAPLARSYDQLEGKARAVTAALLNGFGQLQSYGYGDVAIQMRDLAQRAQDAADGFADGTLEGEAFSKELETIQSEADAAFQNVASIDRAEFTGVTSALAGLATQLANTVGVAESLRDVLNEIDNKPAGKTQLQTFRDADAESMSAWERDKQRRAEFESAEAKRNAMTRDQLDLEREIARVRKDSGESGITLTRLQAKAAAQARIDADDRRREASRPNTHSASGGGSGGGGGAARQSDWQREVESIAEETAALRIEAAELQKVTGAQLHRADAMDLARAKADLLDAALRSGLADTPALRAQVDDMASAYVAAASGADMAAQRITDVQEASQRGARSVASVFEQMATGAMTAREAVGKLILELIKMSLQRRIMETAQGAAGTPLGAVFSILGQGFAGGGWTGPGGKYEPAGVVHRDEFVFSKKATRAIGVSNLDAMHSAAKRGYADGGLVSRSTLRTAPQSSAAPQIAITAPITIKGSAGTPDQNTDLAAKMSRELESTMRGVVVDELRRQMRPGNILSRRRM